jgi:taurine dioxygenase
MLGVYFPCDRAEDVGSSSSEVPVMQVNSDLGPIGAEVSGIDLAEPLTDASVQTIRRAWLDHGVLVFRNQTLSPKAQSEFASRFGELDIYPFMKSLDDDPHVIPIIKEADAVLNFGGDWHTDTSYKEKPPQATLLYALEVPPVGGDTLFADATQAYEDLSPGFRATLDGLTGVYTPKMVHGQGGDYRQVSAKAQLGSAYGGNTEFAESEVLHPIIRTHPETGRKSLYCSRPHTHRIQGWTRAESKELIAFLTRHLTQDQYVTRLTWTKGTLAIWDNRCLFHNALNDYQGHRRAMHRVIIQGDRPF